MVLRERPTKINIDEQVQVMQRYCRQSSIVAVIWRRYKIQIFIIRLVGPKFRRGQVTLDSLDSQTEKGLEDGGEVLGGEAVEEGVDVRVAILALHGRRKQRREDVFRSF
jgi:hypothetical protein